MSQASVLVTGGCGYVGSHVVQQLLEAGYRVVVVDNLSTGFREALLSPNETPLYVVDLCHMPALQEVFDKEPIVAIMDFAASIVVPESVREPLLYYRNNLISLMNLLSCAKTYGVKQCLFSSTAAVYGDVKTSVTETTALQPGSPYGWSKRFGEQMLMDAATAYGLNYVIFRYFNVAGADPKGRLGQRSPQATHLIKLACEVALGKRPHLEILGSDYPTPDGTGVRDYIHVDDLAWAHIEGMKWLQAQPQGGGQGLCLNCGYGQGSSVKDVVASFERVLGRSLPVSFGPRRPGDPASLVAENTKLRSTFPLWQPRYQALDIMVEHAWRWERTYRSTL